MESHDPMNLVVPNTPVTFNQKWEIHKQLLKQLYLDENLKLPKIKSIMRDTHNFDAEVHQYKYRFDKWGWKKSISSRTKARIIDKSQQRLNAGQETVVRYQNRTVDTRKLIRFEKAQMKKQTFAVLFHRNFSRSSGGFNGIAGDTITFMNWNLPYRALQNMLPQLLDHPCPAAMSVSTPSDVSIASPAANTALSPGLSQAVNLKTARQNAIMFVAGDFEGLLKAFSNEDKKAFSTWMYEFWYFSFITAKHWGHGPRNWSVDDLWQNLQNAASPGLLAPSPPARQDFNSLPFASARRTTIPAPGPSPLCRWSIHVSMDEHGQIEWLEDDTPTSFDNTSSQKWPDQWLTQLLEQKLQDGLESNSFSTVQKSQLPVDISYVSQAARKSPDEIWREALGFAIMGRNAELVERMIMHESEEELRALPTRIGQDFYPAHLAAAYLDGGNTCCLIMQYLLSKSYTLNPKTFDRDSNGHTVLDVILLRILRSHSSAPLEAVSDSLRGFQGYAGEEVDVCGRWDAESDSYRKMISSGAVRIPSSWKHKFCHTSIQAVCHCIEALSRSSIPAVSGLFVRRCFNCGMKLELTPLHAMILIALELLEHGMDGEDLFGMICCLLQFAVTNASEAHQIHKSHVSMDLLQDHETRDGCTHEELSPFELARRVDSIAQHCSSQEAYKGWTVFILILQQIEEQQRWVSEQSPPSGYEAIHEAILRAYEEREPTFSSRPELDEILWTREIFHDGTMEASAPCEHLHDYDDDLRAFGRNPHLGHIWAACQAELLTYRRQEECRTWLSQYITIDAILECLQTGDPEVLGHVKCRILGPYCACGIYLGFYHCPRRAIACTSYFSNLDDWQKTSFIPAI